MRAKKAIAILTAALLASAAHAADPAELAVERVTLATGGLALLQGRPADTTDTITLEAQRSHVADVLRTLLVTGDGTVASVDLVGAEGVAPDTPVGRLIAGGLGDPMSLLSAAVGETISIRGGAEQLRGALLGFQRTTVPGDGDAPGRDAVSVSVLADDGGLARATFALDESIDISGDAIDDILEEAVPVLREARSNDRRVLTIRLDGEAQPTLSFVIPTTVWRPSYRAAFDGDGPAILQAWATLENTTGFDWSAVDLQLAVGTPVAFAQDVYAPLRVSRPQAPFAVGQTLETEILRPNPSVQRGRRIGSASDAIAGVMAMAAAPQMEAAVGEEVSTDSALSIFTVPGTIDLSAGRTLSVPFFQSGDVASRSAYFSLMEERPVMDALVIDADAGTQLPGGLIAVYGENGYLGDARFGGSVGGTQIVPFAIASDLTATTTRDGSRSISDLNIGGGMLRIVRQSVETAVVSLQADEQRELVVDIPARSDHEITIRLNGFPVAATQISPDLARLEIVLSEGANELVLTATRTLEDRVTAGGVTPRLIQEVQSLGAELPPDRLAAVQALAQVLNEIQRLEQQIRDADSEVTGLREAITLDRDTLQVIDPSTAEGAELRRRLIERTNTIDALLQRQTDLRVEIATKREAALR